MAYENKPGQATLWLNRDKEKHPKAPDFKGKIVVLGAELEAAAWKRETRNGDEYLFISIQEPYDQRKKADMDQALPPRSEEGDVNF